MFGPALGPTLLSDRCQKAISLGIKQPGREAEHSPYKCQTQEWWSYTSTLLQAFMVWCLIKERDNYGLHSNCLNVSSLSRVLRVYRQSFGNSDVAEALCHCSCGVPGLIRGQVMCDLWTHWHRGGFLRALRFPLPLTAPHSLIVLH
jgi:hypothetical protein